MVAFLGRMGSGFAGEANRTHPISIAPYRNDSTNPATRYGQGVLFTTSGNTVRTPATGDNSATAASIAGVVVRPFPLQAPSAPQPFGGSGTQQTPFGDVGTPPSGQPIDVMTSGFIMVRVNGATVLGGLVYLWCAADAAPHLNGTFEAAATGGSTLLLANARWNSPPDANGIAELAISP